MNFLKKFVFDETVYYKLKFLYILIYIVILELSQIAIFQSFAYNIVNNAILGILALVIISYDLLHKKTIFKSNYNKLLYAFFIIDVISILLNVKYGIKNNVFSLFGVFSNFFLMYSMSYGNKKVIEEFKIMVTVFSIIWFLLVTIGICTYVFQNSYVVTVNGENFCQGFMNSRLFGVFLNINIAAIASLIFAIFSIYIFFNTKKRLLKVFHCTNAIFQYFFIILSGSRTAQIGMYTASLFLFFYLLKKFIKPVYNNFIVRNLICLMFAVGCTFGIRTFNSVCMIALSYVPNAVKMINFDSQDFNQNIKKNFKPINLKRDDVKNTQDISNNRYKIWQNALEIFLKKPFFGVSPKNLKNFVKNNFSQGYIATKNYFNIHNGYMELFMLTGIFGGATMMIFLILSAVKFLKFLHFDSNQENYFSALIIISFVLIIACSSMFTSGFCLERIFITPLFWYFLGYAMYFTDGDNKNK